MAEPEERRKNFFRRRTFKVLLIVLAALLLLWAAVEIGAPLVADSIAKSKINEKYPDATGVSVSIRAFPALKLAFKKYDSLEVKVSGVTLQGVRFDDIELESTAWPEGAFTATIGEDEIERFFSLKNSYVIDPRLSIEEGGIVVAGSVNVGARSVEVSSRGTLEAVDGKDIYFRPGDIQVMEVKVPEEAAERVRQVMEQDPVFVVRDDLPYEINGISVDRGKLVITGTADLEQALNVKL